MQVLLDRVMPADPRSVSAARRLVREAVTEVGFETRADDAALAVSELATNAVVHVGAEFGLRVLTFPAGVRVELKDSSSQLPTAHNFARTAATGRGLRIVEDSVDRWGIDPVGPGKTVWFELGAERAVETPPGLVPDARPSGPRPTLVEITLLDVPLLMHMAWQEHALALLREYLLYRLTDDDQVLTQHAAASEALAALYDQIPQPNLPEDPDALLAETLEPDVTSTELTVCLSASVVASFSTLDYLLRVAVEAAREGHFLGPPTQPEVEEMREWLCQEVLGQAAGDHAPRPWRTRSDIRTPLADPAQLQQQYASLLIEFPHVIVTDEASVIVAASPSVTTFLGYDSPEDLVGRRVIVVVPDRYHQAHIAGTTLNATNGRDELLGVRIMVPIVRADGSEVAVHLEVTPRQLDHSRVFIAELTLPD